MAIAVGELITSTRGTVKACPDVEVCYWFNDTSGLPVIRLYLSLTFGAAEEQYRIAGKAFIVDSESSDALWLSVSVSPTVTRGLSYLG
jgi:hypothetical protein